MIEIPLSKTGKYAGEFVAIVDDCDSDLAEYNWAVVLTPTNCYATRNINGANVLMHRIILARKMNGELPEDKICDHIDTNGLNNSRDNLRPVSRSQNVWNTGKTKRNTTGLKGAAHYRHKFSSQIRTNGVVVHLGVFDTPEEAHVAYCAALLKYRGDYVNDGQDNSLNVQKDKIAKNIAKEGIKQTVIWNGTEYATISDAATANSVPYSVMQKRLLMGYSQDSDLKHAPKIPVIIEGVTYPSLLDAAKAYGLSAASISYHMNRYGNLSKSKTAKLKREGK